MFTNTVPVRVRVEPGLPAKEWLSGYSQARGNVEEHRRTPLPDIQRWAGTEHGVPLFDTVVVFGIVGERFIEGSLRTHSPSVDPAVWLEQAFGHDERGKAYGGGRRDKGGFRIPIGFLGRATDRAQLWALVEHAARQALLKQLGEEPSPALGAQAAGHAAVST